MALEKTWRWFGEKDNISLAELRQIGVEGVVTALHHIPNGEVWREDEILLVKNKIEAQGMHWSVVESLPVSEGIKLANSDRPRLIQNYITSLENLGKYGIDTVCYNFMPVLDWARTDLHFILPGGGESMSFDFPTFVAFDIFVLNRPGAMDDYPPEIVHLAEEKYAQMSQEEAEELAYNIIVVTQGFIDGAVGKDALNYKEVFLNLIKKYDHLSADMLRNNLASFLKDVMPTADQYGIKMCIHPDDPPFPILGLPRIVSTLEDLKWIIHQYPSLNNGVTYCSGSLSAREDNDLVRIVKAIGPNIHFIHLRNTRRTVNHSFFEAGHLEGSLDMYHVLLALLQEQQARKKAGRTDTRMPFRPDHGIKLLDDFSRAANPGYPLVGRLKGLAEITGLEMGIEKSASHKVNVAN